MGLAIVLAASNTTTTTTIARQVVVNVTRSSSNGNTVAVVAAIIAAAASILVVALTYLFTARRETKNWLRQQRLARSIKLLDDWEDAADIARRLARSYTKRAQALDAFSAWGEQADRNKQAPDAAQLDDLVALRARGERLKSDFDSAVEETNQLNTALVEVVETLKRAESEIYLLMGWDTIDAYHALYTILNDAVGSVRTVWRSDGVGSQEFAQAVDAANDSIGWCFAALVLLLRRELGSGIRRRPWSKLGREVKSKRREIDEKRKSADARLASTGDDVASESHTAASA